MNAPGNKVYAIKSVKKLTEPWMLDLTSKGIPFTSRGLTTPLKTTISLASGRMPTVDTFSVVPLCTAVIITPLLPLVNRFSAPVLEQFGKRATSVALIVICFTPEASLV